MPKLIKDQLQRTVLLNVLPRRIVSLVPSQTELLADLGLAAEVVGITKFCIHPAQWFKSKVRVGGTKQFDFKKISELKPDLIIGNKEENEEQAIKQLMTIYPVWMSDIKNIADAVEMINCIGEITGKELHASIISNDILERFKTLNADLSLINKSKTGAYFIWKNPYMVAGHSTFINEMLNYCGLKNVFAGKQSRYPEVTSDELVAANPEVVLLSSEPYPFKEKHLQAFKQLLPATKVFIVDGELFSWYGSRLLHTPAYLKDLMNTIYLT